MRCFEILYSKHLELTSHEAMKKKQKEMRKEFEKQGKRIRKLWCLLITRMNTIALR